MSSTHDRQDAARRRRPSPVRGRLALGATAALLVAGVTACGEATQDAPLTAPDGPAASATTTSPAKPDGDLPAGSGKASVYVSPSGNDGASGSRGRPLRSLGAAIAKARDGGTIALAAGSYPAVQATRRFTRAVRITGPTSGRPATIDGMNAVGASGLSFRNVSFGDTVTLTNSAADLQRETGDVAFRHVHFTTPDAMTSCLAPRNGAHDVTVESSTFRHCFDGIASAGAVSRSGHPIRRILVRGNDIRDMRSDGMNFAYWSGATIERNTITDLHDPAGKIHNDGIQIMGGSSDLKIRDNVLTDSRVQLLFVEPTIGGPVRNLSVENNLIVGAGAAAVQMIDTPGLRFVGNTVAKSRFQGLMIRHAAAQPRIPNARGAVVANNVLAAGYLREPAAALRLETHNVLAGQITGAHGRGDVVGSSPAISGSVAATRVTTSGTAKATADPKQWRSRPRTGPAARTVGYVPRKDWR